LKISEYVSKGGKLPSGSFTKQSFAKEYTRVTGRSPTSVAAPTKAEVRITQRGTSPMQYNPQTDKMSTADTGFISKEDFITKAAARTAATAGSGDTNSHWSDFLKYSPLYWGYRGAETLIGDNVDEYQDILANNPLFFWMQQGADMVSQGEDYLQEPITFGDTPVITNITSIPDKIADKTTENIMQGANNLLIPIVIGLGIVLIMK